MLLIGQVHAASPSLDAEKLPATIKQGIERLNEVYWSKTLNIWLDKPGDDLRAHYEGRLNPPWWPSANAVELLMDYADATGDMQLRFMNFYGSQVKQLSEGVRVRARGELKHGFYGAEMGRCIWRCVTICGINREIITASGYRASPEWST